MVIDTTRAALAKASSVFALSPIRASKATLPGAPANTCCGVRAKRGERIDHGGKRLPIDRKALRAVPGRELRLRDDHGDDVADVVRLVLGHHGIGFKRGLRTVRVCDRPQARKAAEIGEVGRDIHGLDAGNGRCGLAVLNREASVGVRAAHEIGGERVLRREVRGVASGAADQAVVLDAPDRLADPEFHRCHPVNLSVRRPDGQRFVNPQGGQSGTNA